MTVTRALAVAAAALFLAAPPLQAETFVYSKKTGKDSSSFTVAIEKRGRGFFVSTQTIAGGRTIARVRMLADEDLATREWEYWALQDDIRVKAKREGDKILLEGTKAGRPVSVTHVIDGRPWLQYFPFGLERLVLSGETRCEYWAVSPTSFAAAAFSAEKAGEEMVTVLGREERVLKIRVTLAGALSVFWGADYWLRRSDGQYLRFRGTSGPGTPEAYVELVGRTE